MFAQFLNRDPAIGFARDNRPGYDGQWRQAAWAHVARGARMIEYWQWQTLRLGAETYCGGVIPHSGQPGRTYAEVARLGEEFTKAGPLVAGLEPDADITMVHSTPSKWLSSRSGQDRRILDGFRLDRRNPSTAVAKFACMRVQGRGKRMIIGQRAG